MNDKLIAKAIECYIEQLEEENKVLKDFKSEISEVFVYHGITETDTDRLKKIISIVRCYENAIKDGDVK